MENDIKYTLMVRDHIYERESFSAEYNDLESAQQTLEDAKNNFKELYDAWDELEVLHDTPNYYEVSDGEDEFMLRIYKTQALD